MAKRVLRKGEVVIGNVGDQQWSVVRTYRAYVIPACPPGERCSTLTVEDVTDRSGDLGDERKMEVFVPAEKIAEDITADLVHHGVFVCEGEEPTDEEIQAARGRLHEFYRRQVSEADQDWSRHHNHNFISDVQRRAARNLRLEREWLFDPEHFIECEGCGEKLRPGVAVCKSCGAVLDPEKARRLGILPPEMAAAEPAAAAGRTRAARR